MKIYNLGEEHTIINQYVAELRDVNVQKDRMRFRRNLERIGEMMAYEVSKTLSYSTKEVQTPLGIANVCTHDDELVIATVFRAGLPLQNGFLQVFDHADCAFVSAFRYYKDTEHRVVDVKIEYIAAPLLSNKTLLLVDPMLATGESLELAWKAFLTKGAPKKMHIACVIASLDGVKHLQELFADDVDDNITLWCATVDPGMNEHKYIVPGLGDAGDLAYGDKI
ncbi:MAG: uracil phosphoribosyltransferase [Lachnospiraceae bacterium]|jgi:uracil phosphoribosyltransferase|nr:uracil phosphoribosyltransferase [Lachnospiraceae bacterium]